MFMFESHFVNRIKTGALNDFKRLNDQQHIIPIITTISKPCRDRPNHLDPILTNVEDFNLTNNTDTDFQN